MHDLDIVTKSDIKAIVENCMTNWNNTLSLQIGNAMESTFKDTLNVSNLNLIYRLKSAILNVLKLALGEMVRSCRACTSSKAKMCSCIHTKAVADTIVKSELSNKAFFIPIAETAGKMVDRAGGEYRQRKKASKTVTDSEMLIGHSLPRVMRQ